MTIEIITDHFYLINGESRLRRIQITENHDSRISPFPDSLLLFSQLRKSIRSAIEYYSKCQGSIK
jgi:hypothetical protein